MIYNLIHYPPGKLILTGQNRIFLNLIADLWGTVQVGFFGMSIIGGQFGTTIRGEFVDALYNKGRLR